MICPECGTDSIDRGVCTYCPQNKSDLKKERESINVSSDTQNTSRSILSGNVSDIAAAVSKIEDVAALQTLRDEEAAGKARKSVLSEIDGRIADLTKD